MTVHRCQVVALAGRWFNPISRMLMAVKLMDVIVPPTAESMRITPLEECPATVINKVVFFSQIYDHCDIFARGRRGPAIDGPMLPFLFPRP
jgi:hypothetical protein